MKVNIHVTEKCNFHCRQCYAKFDEFKAPTIDEWMKIIDNCMYSGIVDAFNFAGGEPLLYKDLDKLIEYTTHKGAAVSIITNGYLITPEWIKKNARHLKTVGFSIDSFFEDTIRSIGRCTSTGKFLDVNKLIQIINLFKQYNPDIKIKINTVVSSLNKTENIAAEIIKNKMSVDRWKLLKMCLFKNDSFNNYDLAISDDDYHDFVKRNVETFGIRDVFDTLMIAENGTEIVVEQHINGGYIMIDSGGYLVDDTLNTNYTRICNCIHEDFSKGISKLNFNETLYNSRYDCKA